MLVLTDQGLYCPEGDFFIDPKGKVERAVVTHAHADHARCGAGHYYAARPGVGLLRARLGQKIQVTGVPYGERFRIGPVTLSFHSAGHILGSAQVRLEAGGEVWVASGDYKREPDPTCAPFEPVRCDVFVTEATFGTPGYVWEKEKDLGREIFEWWEANRAAGFNSVVFAYSLGKTQRVLGELSRFTREPVYCAESAGALNECYRAEGVRLAPTICLSTVRGSERLRGALVLAPQSWLKGPGAAVLGEAYRTAFASGWMARSEWGYDRGFTMSDHADWPDLLRTVRESGARTVYVQHRGSGALVRELRRLGIEAHPEERLAQAPKPRQLALF